MMATGASICLRVSDRMTGPAWGKTGQKEQSRFGYDWGWPETTVSAEAGRSPSRAQVQDSLKLERSMPEPEALRPMSEFDPSQTVLVHDQLNDEEFEWWPARQEHYERYARRLRDGRVA